MEIAPPSALRLKPTWNKCSNIGEQPWLGEMVLILKDPFIACFQVIPALQYLLQININRCVQSINSMEDTKLLCLPPLHLHLRWYLPVSD